MDNMNENAKKSDSQPFPFHRISFFFLFFPETKVFESAHFLRKRETKS